MNEKTRLFRIVAIEPSYELYRWLGSFVGRSALRTVRTLRPFHGHRPAQSAYIVEMTGRSATRPEVVARIVSLAGEHQPILVLSKGHTMRFRQEMGQLGIPFFDWDRSRGDAKAFVQSVYLRDPSTILMSFRISDSGLTVMFGDGRLTTIGFPTLRRLAESDRLQLDRIRIARDRRSLWIGVDDAEEVPLPFDVLREYVDDSADTARRSAKNKRRRGAVAEAVGEKVRRFREEIGLTQVDLASRSRCSRWTILRLEAGRLLPKVSALSLIARALGLSMEELLSNRS